MELKIDPEFAGKIPPLTEEEFRQLETNILEDGRILSPLIVWNGTIVDGHNRYRILQKHAELSFEVYEREFKDRYEAIIWICRNQLGRRNLTDEQKKFLTGKRYEAEKKQIEDALSSGTISVEAITEMSKRLPVLIAELDEKVASLNTNVTSLKEDNEKKEETITSQDKALHTAWFVFGTKDELKEQRILSKDGLFSKTKLLEKDFNKDYFTKIDIRIDKEIKLYSKSAEILTSHPASSYTLQRDANKQYVLRITNPDAFWSTSKYLVIQVK